MSDKSIKVGMGELHTGGSGDVLTAYGIGSCIVVVCFDVEKPRAGMLHAMLPEKIGKGHDKNRYADTGIENLVKAMIDMGVNIKDMRAKIFGGARMFEIGSQGDSIGNRNVKKAKEILEKKGILILGEDTGSNYGRTIEYFVTEKKAKVKSFGRDIKIV
ncbi:MAG: chemotaxis protein CheD [Candidatus Goldiibacteriota bacterium HGW-Goldbacteria-1]|jgi:chemotaxis protein CheD|nr:MAG: chemotaxis protein CheD [Candidatus Goldiibacteriota bacterium HGW-Goldbacteria-1]